MERDSVAEAVKMTAKQVVEYYEVYVLLSLNEYWWKRSQCDDIEAKKEYEHWFLGYL